MRFSRHSNQYSYDLMSLTFRKKCQNPLLAKVSGHYLHDAQKPVSGQIKSMLRHCFSCFILFSTIQAIIPVRKKHLFRSSSSCRENCTFCYKKTNYIYLHNEQGIAYKRHFKWKPACITGNLAKLKFCISAPI